MEKQIQNEIDSLKEQAFDTQSLYREACAILFFRYGITPTANKLYHYVRKGSMSAPAEALSKFWEELREKSRIRIERPDLPEEIKEITGEFISQLWKQAQTVADENLASLKEDVEKAIIQAKLEQQSVEGKLTEQNKVLEKTLKENEQLAEAKLQLERGLAATNSKLEETQLQLQAAIAQHKIYEEKIYLIQKEFSRELEKQRESLKLAEARFEASEKRALLEIDHERNQTARIQKELVHLRESSLKVAEEHLLETKALQAELALANTNLGINEGSLQELRKNNHTLSEEIRKLSQENADQKNDLLLLQNEIRHLKQKADIHPQKIGTKKILLVRSAKKRSTSD